MSLFPHDHEIVVAVSDATSVIKAKRQKLESWYQPISVYIFLSRCVIYKYLSLKEMLGNYFVSFCFPISIVEASKGEWG